MSETTYKYAILMETSDQDAESWYNFIRVQGNEEALQHLLEQLEKVEFEVSEETSAFDLELVHLVSEQTAKEMCSVDLNSRMFHRKFDGKLQKINFGFSKRDSNEDRIDKVHELIGFGDIDQFVDGEDPCNDGYELYSTSSSSDEDEKEVEDNKDKKKDRKHYEKRLEELREKLRKKQENKSNKE